MRCAAPFCASFLTVRHRSAGSAASQELLARATGGAVATDGGSARRSEAKDDSASPRKCAQRRCRCLVDALFALSQRRRVVVVRLVGRGAVVADGVVGRRRGAGVAARRQSALAQHLWRRAEPDPRRRHAVCALLARAAARRWRPTRHARPASAASRRHDNRRRDAHERRHGDARLCRPAAALTCAGAQEGVCYLTKHALYFVSFDQQSLQRVKVTPSPLSAAPRSPARRRPR